MSKRIFQLATAGTVTGVEMVEASQPSTTVTITASTISSAASDNSLNDSGGGLLVAGFTAGKTVYLSGFTGGQSAGFGVVDSVTANKMILTGITLVDDSAGESVTITQWDSVRVATADLSGGTAYGKQAIPVMAAQMVPRVTGGCAALAYMSMGTDKPDVPYLAFDSAAAEYAEFAITMPSSWNEGTVTFKSVWAHPATTTNFGAVFALQAVAVGNDDTLDVTFGTAQNSADTGGTTSDLYIGPESSAITVAGTPQAGDTVFFRLARLPSDGADTLAVDAYLIGIVLYITTDASVDV